jgi:hypothetical protein
VSTPPRSGAGPDARPGHGASAGWRARTKGTLWTVDAQGRLAKHLVTTGLSDGKRTQVQGDGIAAGSSIVIGLSENGTTDTAPSTTNPLQASGARGGRGGPPGGF